MNRMATTHARCALVISGLAVMSLGACYEELSEDALCHYLDPACAHLDFDGDGLSNAVDFFPTDPECGATADCSPTDGPRGTVRLKNDILSADGAYDIARVMASPGAGGDEVSMIPGDFIVYGSHVDVSWAAGNICLRAQDTEGDSYTPPCVDIEANVVTEVTFSASDRVLTTDFGKLTIANALEKSSLIELYVYASWSVTPGRNILGDLPLAPQETIWKHYVSDEYEIEALSANGVWYAYHGVAVATGDEIYIAITSTSVDDGNH